VSYLQVTITAEVIGMVAVKDTHVPVGRLDDGTPVFAPVGRMTAVDGHRRVRQRFGLRPRTSLTAPGTASFKAAEGHSRYGGNTGVHGGLAAGRARTAAVAEAARRTRLAQLGYPDDLTGYLRDRYIRRGQ
jgi:hypothetical protein